MNDYFSTYPETAHVGLDPRVAAVLRERASATPFFRMPLDEGRPAFEAMAAAAPRLAEAVEQVEEIAIPGPGGKVGLRVYTPLGESRGGLLFIHGGGWVIGSPRSHDDLCRSLCHRAGVTVASVDYRLAPEHKFPAALHDCYAALEWLAAQSRGGRLVVAGDSAGGNLSAALALYARDRGGPPLQLQVLIYPVTNHNLDTASYHQWAEGFGLMRDAMRFFWDSYLSRPSDGLDPYASPLQAANLAGLPPALIQTAHYDVLRDEGEAYAARLRRAGVPVQCTRYLAMNHGFVQFAGLFEQGRVAIEEIAAAIREPHRCGTAS